MDVYFIVLNTTDTPCETGLCVEVSPSYKIFIGTSFTLNFFLLDLIKISVDTPIPLSDGIISLSIFFLYALNPL